MALIKRGVGERGRVQRHAVGTGLDDADRVLDRSHAAADGERDLQHVGDVGDDRRHRRASPRASP